MRAETMTSGCDKGRFLDGEYIPGVESDRLIGYRMGPIGSDGSDGSDGRMALEARAVPPAMSLIRSERLSTTHRAPVRLWTAPHRLRDRMDAESDSVEFIESDREKEVSELDAGELADLRERAGDGGEEAIAALREAGRWPETGTLETGAGTAASKPKEKAEAPSWRKLTDFRRC